MNTTILMVIVLFSVFLVVYHHLIYPLILRFIYKYKTKDGIEKTDCSYKLPSITLIIPAFNEQQWVADKIRNLSILDYPKEKLTIIIACDGCTDNTVAIATKVSMETACLHLNIKIKEFKINRGKVSVLNRVLQSCDSDLIALSDVSALLSIDAFKIAAQHFNDPKVGVLNPHYCLLNSNSSGEQIYWDYQSHIKESESLLGSTVGAHGAFYIFRRHLFTPLAEDTINDDFILPMSIVAMGYRAEYDNKIKAIELEQANNKMDYQRRCRIAAGNFQQLLRLKNLLSPKYGGIAFAFISGKGLRVLMPFFMLISFLGSLVLAGVSNLFLLLAMLQIIAYLIAMWQLIFKPKQSHKILHALSYLVSGHIAGAIGVLRYIFGLERGNWKRVN